MAIGVAAFGGLAIGSIAMGGVAIGRLAIGDRAIGEFVLEIEKEDITRQTATELFNSAYPNMPDWLIQMFTWFFRQ